MANSDINDIIRLLNLQPLPGEGGLFRQTYRSEVEIPAALLPERYAGDTASGAPRPLVTTIFYLLTDQFAETDSGESGALQGDPPPGESAAGADRTVGAEAAFSHFHRLRTDEIFHFYLGDALEMTLLYPDGTSRQVILGQDLLHGQQVQFVAPHGVWQGTRLVSGGRFALVGTTMAPGYIDADYEHGDRAALLAQYPHEHERILALTR